MQRALGAKNKLPFTNGSLCVPDHDDLNRNAWERCNHLIHSWIINSMFDFIAQTIVFHDNAFDVCNSLHTSIYPISNYVSHHELSNLHSHFFMSIHSNPEPKTYIEASKFEC
jgi:hypothetical protein